MTIFEVWLVNGIHVWCALRTSDENEATHFYNSKSPQMASLWVKSNEGNVLRINGVWVVKPPPFYTEQHE